MFDKTIHHDKFTVQLKQFEWNAAPSASTHLSPASIGYWHDTHLVVNNAFQSRIQDHSFISNYRV